MCLYSKEVSLIQFTQPLVLSAAVRKIISQILLSGMEKMPIWPDTHSLMKKCLYEGMCQKFGPVRKLLSLLVGPPVLVPTGGAIFERFADSGRFITPRLRCSTGPWTLQRANRERIATSELDFWWRI